MVDGEVIFRDGTFTRIDHKAVLAEIAEVFAKPRTDSEAKRRWLRHEIFPEVEKFYASYLRDEQKREPFYHASSRT
jgi:hypothetical protein